MHTELPSSAMPGVLCFLSREHPQIVSAVAWCLCPGQNRSLHGHSPFLSSPCFRCKERCCLCSPTRQRACSKCPAPPSPGGVEAAVQKLGPSFQGKLVHGKTLSALNQPKGNAVKTIKKKVRKFSFESEASKWRTARECWCSAVPILLPLSLRKYKTCSRLSVLVDPRFLLG